MTNIVPVPESKASNSQVTSIPVYRIAVGVGALGALWLIYTIVWMAVSAGAGLLALSGIGLVGVGVFRALPYFGQLFENRLLKARKREARKNPLEQLQNFLAAKTAQVEAFARATTAIGAQVKGLEQTLNDRKKQRHNGDYAKQDAALGAMKTAHEAYIRQLTQAREALDQLREKIEDKQFEYKFALEGQAAMQSLSSASGQQILDSMLADEAFASIRDHFNEVFSGLEVQSAQLSANDRLSFGEGFNLDLKGIEIPGMKEVT